MADQTITIGSEHNGPPGSGHGGVTVGRLAGLIGSGPAEVRLLAPPPLGTELLIRSADGSDPAAGLVAAGPGGDVATVSALAEEVAVDAFARATSADLDDAATQYLDRVAETGHAFPTCFGCGPERGDDALRQFTGVAPDGDTLARFRVPGEGRLPDWLTIAGLDCPSGWTVFMLTVPSPEAVVLASMQCQVHEPTIADVDYQVRGRLLSSDGRKHFTEVAMLDPDGDAVAAARTLWIEVDPAAFGA
jgi:hypothetical protein